MVGIILFCCVVSRGSALTAYLPNKMTQMVVVNTKPKLRDAKPPVKLTPTNPHQDTKSKNLNWFDPEHGDVMGCENRTRYCGNVIPQYGSFVVDKSEP